MTYRVTGTRVVLPNDVDSLTIKKDKDLVTLVTCLKYPMNYKRLLVYGERVN
ncbi:sortase [Alkalibacterium sp. f15]|uniref:sortase n=1 Tax=Alkalibacterium sp. f15 TaxID=3414029 RepID=UPI003BF79A6F